MKLLQKQKKQEYLDLQNGNEKEHIGVNNILP
jgi:hypothetical protein